MTRVRLLTGSMLVLLAALCAPWSAAAQVRTGAFAPLELGILLDTDASADPKLEHAALESAEWLLSLLPDTAKALVARTFPRVQHSGDLQHDWPPGALRQRLNAARGTAPGDLNAALHLVRDRFSRDDDVRRVLLVVFTRDPGPPDARVIDGFIEQGVRLHVLTPEGLDLPEGWSESLGATGGGQAVYRDADSLTTGLFRLFLASVKPQMLEIGGVNFQVDSVSAKVTVVARADESQGPMTLIGPENRRVTIRRDKQPNEADLRVTRVGPLTVIELDKPRTGLWGLRGVHGQDMVVLTDSRQSLHVNLPRNRALQSENLPLSAYMLRDGAIVKLIAESEQIGFFAVLVDDQGLRAASAPLLDNGEHPDAIPGDGVFSAALPLDGLRGDYTLWVVARTEQVARTLSDRVTVLPGDWVTVTHPGTPPLPGETREYGLAFSPALPFHRDTRIQLTFDGQHPELRPDPINRLGFKVTLAIRAEDLATRKTLSLVKTVPYDDMLLVDRQTLRVGVEVGVLPKKSPAVMILVVLLVLVNLAGAGVWLVLRFRKPPQTVTPQDEQPEETPPEPRKAPPKPAKPAAFLDEPLTETVTMESVTDRLSEVAAVHRGETVRADINRVELRPEDLDRDGDPEFASGTAFDATDQWGQMIESRLESPRIPETPVSEDDQPPSDGGFERLTGADISDIFDTVWHDTRAADVTETKSQSPGQGWGESPFDESPPTGATAVPVMEEEMLFGADAGDIRVEDVQDADTSVLGAAELEDLIARQKDLAARKISLEDDPE